MLGEINFVSLDVKLNKCFAEELNLQFVYFSTIEHCKNCENAPSPGISCIPLEFPGSLGLSWYVPVCPPGLLNQRILEVLCLDPDS